MAIFSKRSWDSSCSLLATEFHSEMSVKVVTLPQNYPQNILNKQLQGFLLAVLHWCFSEVCLLLMA